MPSGTKHEFSSPEKQEWRERNLEFLVSYGREIWEHKPRTVAGKGRLRPHVVELLGTSGHLSFELLERFLSNPKSFIGVEKNPQTVGEAVFENREKELPFQVQYGDIGKYVYYSKDPVSVINWDDTRCAGTKSWWKEYRPRIEQALKRHSQVVGEVAFILNMSLRGRKDPHEVHEVNIRIMREQLADIFRVRPELVVKDTTVARGRKPKHVVETYDSIEFYTSELTPMVTFRAIYDAQGHHRLQGM